VERNRKAGQNPPTFVAPTEDEEEETEPSNLVLFAAHNIILHVKYFKYGTFHFTTPPSTFYRNKPE
jgi:hypothetical protein